MLLASVHVKDPKASTNFDFVGARVGNYQSNPQCSRLLDQLWVR